MVKFLPILEASFYSKLDATATPVNLWDLLKYTVACISFFQANRETDRICSLQFRLVLGPRAHLQDQSQTCHKSCNSKCAPSKHLDFTCWRFQNRPPLAGTGSEGLKKIQCKVMMWDLYVWSYVCFLGRTLLVSCLIFGSSYRWIPVTWDFFGTDLGHEVSCRESIKQSWRLWDDTARAGTGRMHISTGNINRKWQDLRREESLLIYVYIILNLKKRTVINSIFCHIQKYAQVTYM